MSDSLSIEIDVDRARASLESLGSSIERLISQLSKIESASGVDKLGDAFKGLKFDPQINEELTKLQVRLGTLAVERVTQLKDELSRLNPAQVNEAATALQRIQSLTDAINSRNVSELNNALRNSGQGAGEAATGFERFVNMLRTAATTVQGLGTSLGGAGASLSNIANAASAVSGATQGATAGLSGMSAAGAALVAVGAAIVIYEIGKALASVAGPAITAEEAVVKFTSALNTVSKDNLGDKLFKTINDNALKTGIAFSSVADQAKKFAVAAQASGVSTEILSRTFSSLQIGFRGAGLSAAETGRAFTALEQMMSKGKIQAQELVIQLGNAVPGALAVAARAAGTTTAGLQEMARAGLLLPTDFVAKFGREMEKTFGGAFNEQLRTVSAQLGIMGAAFEHLGQAVGGGQFIGLMRGMADLLRGVNDIILVLLPGLMALGAAIGDTLGGALSFVGGILSGFAQGLQLLGNIVQIVVQAFTFLVTNIGNAGTLFTNMATTAGLVVTAFTDWLRSFEGVGEALDAFNAKIASLGEMFTNAVNYVKSFGDSIAQMAQGFVAWLSSTELVQGALTLLGQGMAYVQSGVDYVKAGFEQLATLARQVGEDIKWFAENTMLGQVAVFALQAAMEGVKAIFDGLSAIVKAAIGNFQGLGQTIGIFLGVLAGVTAAYYAGTAAVALYTLALGGHTLASGLAAAATWALNAALMALPFVAIAAVITIGIQALAGWAKEAVKAKDETVNLSDNLKRIQAAANEGAKGLQELANGFGTVEGVVARTKERVAQMESALKNTKLESSALGRAQEDLATSTQRANAEHKLSRDVLGSVTTAARAAAEEERKSNREHEATVRLTQGATAARREHGNALTFAAERSHELSRASAAASAADKLSADRAKLSELATKELAQAMKHRIEKTQEQIAEEKRFGTVIDESNAKFLALGLAMGKTDEDAGRFAISMKLLTQSQEELKKSGDEEIAALRVKIGAYNEAIKIIDATIERRTQEMNLTKDQAARNAEIQALQAQRTALAGTAQQLTLAALATEVLSGKTKEEADYRASAARVMEKYGAAASELTNTEGLATAALNQLTAGLTTNNAATEKTAAASNTAATAQEKLAAQSKSAADQAAATAENSTKLTTTLEGLTGKLDGLTTNFNSLASAIGKTSDGLKNVNDYLTSIVTTIETIGTSLPVLEKLNIAVGALGDNAAKIKALGEALAALPATFQSISDVTVKTVEVMSRLAAAANNVGIGFDSATKNIGTFRDTLGTLEGPLDRIIQKMGELKAAAEAALAAAQAAAAAQSQSNSPTTETQQNRYGGYATSMTDPMRVPSSAFAGAPHFAEGTANTSDLSRSIRGGGIPAILHANEAVVPLPKGRSIPVDLTQKTDSNAVAELASAVAGSVSSSLTEALANQPTQNTVASPKNSPTTEAPLRESAPVAYATVKSAQATSAPATDDSGGQEGRTRPGKAPVTIHMNITTPDADSFRKSKDQIHAEMFTKMRAAFNRNN